MKSDNLDIAYRNVKLSTTLFVISILSTWLIKPLLVGSVFSIIGDLLSAGPMLAAGVISSVGFVYALKGSQYGKRNPKKRFFGLFGNFIFAFILIALIVVIISDFKRHLG